MNRLRKNAKVEENICLGCGVCIRGCNKNAVNLINRKSRVVTPVNSVHRIVMMAIERGKLQNLIFGTPVKQILAGQQFKSGYLESLIRRKI